MVKITDPSENKQKKKINIESKEDGLEISLTPHTIKELMKINKKTKTNSIHLRVNESITDQIKLYANEHETTVTTVITDIITNHFTTKRVMKGSIKLNKPLTLFIPTSKELIKDFIDNKVNLIPDDLEGASKMYLTINNDLDVEKYKLYDSDLTDINIFEVNNLLDVYDPENHFYYDGYGYILTEAESQGIPEDYYNYHRGISIFNIRNKPTEELEELLVETLTYKNRLIEAKFITIERAIELAEETNNYELIHYLETLEESNNINEVLEHRFRELELERKIEDMKEEIDSLRIELIQAKEEAELSESLLNQKDSLENFVNDDSKEKIKYVQGLENENKRLIKELNKYKFKSEKYDKQMVKIESMIREYEKLEKNI